MRGVRTAIWGLMAWFGVACGQSSVPADRQGQSVEPAETGGAWDTDTGGEAVGRAAALFPLADTTTECCEKTGLADECWEQDAVDDGVTCNSNADCASGVCDMSTPGKTFKGLCTCTADDQCGNGVCDTDAGRCGPSWCNGYYICSCLGGCVWWNEDRNRVPADDAAAVSRTCCDGTYPSGQVNGGFFSIASDCGAGTAVVTGCTADTECDDTNACTQDACDTASGVCSHLITVGAECEADGLGCTIDRCDAGANCVFSAPRCPPDSYDVDSKPNTCTIDCVEDPSDTDSNGETWTCYVDQPIPIDTDVKDVTGACAYWACDTSASPHIPVEITQAMSDAACSAAFDDECNSYACDPAGARGNCQKVTMAIGSGCTAYDTANLCIDAQCADADSDGIATCDTDTLPPPVPDVDPCRNLACDPPTGSWNYVEDTAAVAAGAACDDSDACTQTDVCSAGGVCVGTPVVCADTPCADYECDGATGTCTVNQFFDATVSCVDGDGLWCTYGLCNGSGGCAPNSVDCNTAPASECNMKACMEAIDSCAEIADPAQIGQPCLGVSGAPNCVAECVAVPHFNATLAALGESSGECQLTGVDNDTCATARNLGAFSLSDPNGTTVGEFGSTACGATNDHYAQSPGCWESAGVRMGFFSPDVVYSFTYEASGTGKARSRYVIKVEPESGFDAAVYVSTSCDTSATPAPVAGQACVDNGQGGTQEDFCRTPYDCTPVDGTYTGVVSEAIVYEDTSAAAGQLVTVYVYVDGTRDVSAAKDTGAFYVSVTKETNCPDPATWYSGTIHTVIEPGVNDLAVPINGTDFPGVVPAPAQQTGSRGTVPAVVLTGDTRSATNAYTGEPTDTDPFAFAGKDELWQLDILADGVTFAASLCDYGGWVDTDATSAPPYNPTIALFNCFGERLAVNDDSWACGSGSELSAIDPTPGTVQADGPYYVLVDGRFENGVTGRADGNRYGLSIYYPPPPETTPCNGSTSPSPLNLTLPGDIHQVNFGEMNYYPSGCIAVDFTGGNCDLNDFVTHANNKDLNVRTNGIQPGAQKCDWNGNSTPPSPSETYYDSSGTAFKCFPIYINYDIIYYDVNTLEQWVVSGSIIQYDRHGNTLSGKIPIEPRSSLLPPDAMASWNAGTLNIRGINLGFTHVDNLTAEQIAICEANCTKTDIFYIDWQPTQGTCR